MAKSASTRRQPKSGSKAKRRGKNRQIVLPGQYFFASSLVMHRRFPLKPCYETRLPSEHQPGPGFLPGTFPVWASSKYERVCRANS